MSSIAFDDPLPLELDIKARWANQTGPSDTSSMSSDEGSLSSLSSAGSFQEAKFRLESISTRLDSLYKLAVRIRNPRSRLQRPIQQLYKHIPESQREEYRRNQEQIEISRISYIQQNHLLVVNHRVMRKFPYEWLQKSAIHQKYSHGRQKSVTRNAVP